MASTCVTKGQSAAMGIGAGLAVMVLIAAATAAFWLLRRRRSSAGGSITSVTSAASVTSADSVAEETWGGEPRSFFYRNFLHFDLLQEGAIADLERLLLGFSMVIDDHLANFYHYDEHSDAPDPTTLFDSLAPFALDEQTRHTMVRMCIDPKSWKTAMRHIIARIVLANMDLDMKKPGPRRLLPPIFDALLQNINDQWHRDYDPDTTFEVMFYWRRCTAYLMCDFPRDRNHCLRLLKDSEAQVTAQAEAFASLLNGFLKPFAKPGADEKGNRMKHLLYCIGNFMRLGLSTLGHEYELRLSFPTQLSETYLPVGPGLDILTSQDGEMLQCENNVFKPQLAHLETGHSPPGYDGWPGSKRRDGPGLGDWLKKVAGEHAKSANQV